MEKQEELTLTFIKGRDGKTIAKTDEGKICLLDIPYCKASHTYVHEFEDWRCAVKEVKDNCLIVQPITLVTTSEENHELMGVKLDDLKSKFTSEKEEGRTKR
jgi:hypothetical protein